METVYLLNSYSIYFGWIGIGCQIQINYSAKFDRKIKNHAIYLEQKQTINKFCQQMKKKKKANTNCEWFG